MNELEFAWSWRKQKGFFANRNTLRIFHTPQLSIDKFGDHYWIADGSQAERSYETIVEFLRQKGAKSAVVIQRKKNEIRKSHILFGDPPREKFEVEENGIKYSVQLFETTQPGLFLDHAPLRRWLREFSHAARVLNTFSYTGSLSVACGLGGAKSVTNLDLSSNSNKWSKENWLSNGLPIEHFHCIVGDVFEWLPRLAKKGEKFDVVILDPPSFSRSQKGVFSTEKDLKRLIDLVWGLLNVGGVLVVSINSAGVSLKALERDLLLSAGKRKLNILKSIEQPETFLSSLGSYEERYLKGYCLQVAG